MPKNQFRIQAAVPNDNRTWNRLLELAQRRAINVYFSNLPPRVNGLHFKTNDVEIIILNLVLTDVTKINFVFAHELGHAQLHNGLDCALYHQFGDYHGVIEQQADRFAEKLIRLLKRR